MSSRIEQYALIGDTQTAGARRRRRLDRLALRPAIRFRRVLRRAPGEREERTLAHRPGGGRARDPPEVPRRHARARDRIRHPRGHRARHRLHADPGPHHRRRPRRRRGQRRGPDEVRAHRALRLRIGRAVGAVVGQLRLDDRGTERAPAQRSVQDRRPRDAPRGRLRRARRRQGAVRAHLVPVVPQGRRRPRSIRSARSGRTTAWWKDWSSRSTYHGKWEDLVQRSLITLKALTFAPTGGIVAAPTTSLPEWPGSVRNWDYRYCWLRDSTFTLYSLMTAGYVKEAVEWRDWLLRAVAGDPAHLQIMYGTRGERRLTEYEVRLAARLREVGAGARRQRGLGTVPARRLRRGRRLAAPDAPDAGARGSERVGAPARHPRVPRGGLEGRRRGHLGGARRAPRLHPLEGDGVGRVRPRGARRSSSSGSTGRSTRGAPRATRSTGRSASVGSTPSATPSRSTTARRRSTPAR